MWCDLKNSPSIRTQTFGLCCSCVRIGTVFPQWVADLFRFGSAAELKLTKSFVFSAQPVVKRMQKHQDWLVRVQVMSDRFAQSHSDLDCMFVSSRFCGGPGSLS
jgi:hypothetical protein